MNTKRDFGFALGQTVNIPEAGAKGRIDAVMDSLDGIQYRLSFWVDGQRRVEWVYPHEIESLQKVGVVQPCPK